MKERRERMTSRDFSIYLLSEGFDGSNSLKSTSQMRPEKQFEGLPTGSSVYILDGKPYTPWWRDYFGIKREIKQASKGAIVFVPIDQSWIALCFGHVSSNLKEDCFEYDFGLRTTLNCVDPKKLRNTDTAEPGTARRRRTQLTVSSDLTLFDIDRDSTILRSLTGKVRDEFTGVITQATGATISVSAQE